MGFTLLAAERESLVRRDPRNSERIFPYLGGEEVNASPDQRCRRFVIDFGQLSLSEASSGQTCSRCCGKESSRSGTAPEPPALPLWRFWRRRDELYASIAHLRRCLVTNAQASKHLMFVLVAPGVVFANSLNVFPLDRKTAFALLQSRIHGAWSWRLSSSLGEGIRYNTSDCLRLFRFQKPIARRPA